jgi:hypothetical protein
VHFVGPTLQAVLDDARFAIDQAGNRIIVKGTDATQQQVAKLLAELDTPSKARIEEDTPPQAAAVRVRAIWLVRSDKLDLEKLRLPKPSDDLADVVAELAEIGIDGLRQVGQALVNTTNDSQFELSCSPKLRPELPQSTLNWTAEGSFLSGQGKEQAPRLEIQLTAAYRESGTTLASIQTLLTTPYGHHTVLCAVPTGDMTSVFVVQVTRID